MSQSVTLVWLRRDLRIFDNTALQTSIRRGLPVAAAFVFDTGILDNLSRDDRRIGFIRDSVAELQGALAEKGIPLWVLHGHAEAEIPTLAGRLNAAAVVCAEDYEPAAVARDNRIWRILDADNRELLRVTDQAVFAKADIMNHQGRPYTVFTPYKNAWLQTYAQRYGAWQPADDWAAVAQLQTALPDAARNPPPVPSCADLGFSPQPSPFAGGETAAQKQLGRFLTRIADYGLTRDFPVKQGSSNLSPYLRFGLLSPRHLAFLARQADCEGASVWLSELVWREFFMQILFHFPHAATENFRPEYRDLVWENNPLWLERWQNGQTGYPLVDAAMRCLSKTGTLHNRLRMVAACFLTKDLLTDWRHGESWFAAHLMDYDLAANSGNWQWAAGTGCDAQPYFRVFNPVLQSQKYDPDGHFIRRYVPELAHLGKDTIHAPWLAKGSIDTHGYPAPVVNHAEQREKAVAMFKAMKDKAASDL